MSLPSERVFPDTRVPHQAMDVEDSAPHGTPSDPLVSVIMIFFNAEPFIAEAIDSVLAQTYATWELVLVDDGSTDGSTAIALEYQRRYPQRINCVSHESHRNRGMSASRNLGISRSRGEFVAFLDADDVWLPRKLEEQVAILQANPPAAMVYGPVQWWYSWTGNPIDRGRDHVPPVRGRQDALVHPPEPLLQLLRHEGVTTTAALVRREAIDRVGGFEESFGGLYEDQAFDAKLCCSAPVFVASRCWYRWRKHDRSHCAVAVRTGRYFEARRKFLAWLEHYLSDRDMRDPELWRVLRRERRRYRFPMVREFVARFNERRRTLTTLVKRIGRRVLPRAVVRQLQMRRDGREYRPNVGEVVFGDMRRLVPVSPVWGFDRGTPIDRYYIERFLAAHAADIRGRVLEFQDDSYVRQFGAAEHVRSIDILHSVAGNPRATVVADLVHAENIAADTYDCIICTQTLHFIYDVRAAMRTLYRILKPGGTLLATVPGISKISRDELVRWGEYWRFTTSSAERICTEVFPHQNVSVQVFGNVLSSTAFLHGVAAEELEPDELEHRDPDYQLVIAVRATKPR